MSQIANFDELFDLDYEIPPHGAYISDINSKREISGYLFIDLILNFLGVTKPDKFYPFQSKSGLRELHTEMVAQKTGSDHHKLSIFYYVALDIDWISNKGGFSKAFIQKSFLPKKYQTLIKGLWHMDHQEFETALQYLADPSLIPSFPDEILEALLKSSNDDLTLPLAYYHTVQHAIKKQEITDCLLSALARQSVTDAYFFSHTVNESYQKHSFEMLISLVLSGSSNCTVAERCLELVNLPFTPIEEKWFEEYLMYGKGCSFQFAKDTLRMRYIGIGKFSEFLSCEDLDTKTINGLNWGVISNSVRSGLDSRSAT